jgi:hypothetical protein
VLSSLGNIKIEAPAKRTFDAEGAILKQVLSDCLRDRHTVLAQLADATRRPLDRALIFHKRIKHF